jgi:hypothetical protein
MRYCDTVCEFRGSEICALTPEQRLVQVNVIGEDARRQNFWLYLRAGGISLAAMWGMILPPASTDPQPVSELPAPDSKVESQAVYDCIFNQLTPEI